MGEGNSSQSPKEIYFIIFNSLLMLCFCFCSQVWFIMRYFYTWRRLFFPAPQGCNPSVSVLMCHCLRRGSAFKPLHQHLKRRSYQVEPQRGPVIVLTFDMECWIHIAVPFLAIKSLLSVVQLVYEVKGFINCIFQAELAMHILPFIITVTLLQQHV